LTKVTDKKKSVPKAQSKKPNPYRVPRQGHSPVCLSNQASRS